MFHLYIFFWRGRRCVFRVRILSLFLLGFKSRQMSAQPQTNQYSRIVRPHTQHRKIESTGFWSFMPLRDGQIHLLRCASPPATPENQIQPSTTPKSPARLPQDPLERLRAVQPHRWRRRRRLGFRLHDAVWLIRAKAERIFTQSWRIESNFIKIPGEAEEVRCGIIASRVKGNSYRQYSNSVFPVCCVVYTINVPPTWDGWVRRWLTAATFWGEDKINKYTFSDTSRDPKCGPGQTERQAHNGTSEQTYLQGVPCTRWRRPSFSRFFFKLQNIVKRNDLHFISSPYLALTSRTPYRYIWLKIKRNQRFHSRRRFQLARIKLVATASHQTNTI